MLISAFFQKKVSVYCFTYIFEIICKHIQTTLIIQPTDYFLLKCAQPQPSITNKKTGWVSLLDGLLYTKFS